MIASLLLKEMGISIHTAGAGQGWEVNWLVSEDSSKMMIIIWK